jgi:mono/diheme cytochrome c family protein
MTVWRWSLVLLAAAALVAGGLLTRELLHPNWLQQPAARSVDFSPAQIERGAYLAKLGNCAACHTARGGEPFAGGRALGTPFGDIHATNITPEPAHGIGRWSADAFERALRRGISANGRLLTPAFPFTNYRWVTREDSDALYAYFMKGVAPSAQANRPNDLRFPANQAWAMAAWRVLYADAPPNATAIENIATKARQTPATGLKDQKLAVLEPPATPQQLQRGAYLVQGLGHCNACHGERNALGALRSEWGFAGALMPTRDWYAPSLHARDEAGVQHWRRAEIVNFLRNGLTHQASAVGPMGEVVSGSTQHWSDTDLQATAAYLQALPLHADVKREQPTLDGARKAQGAALYAQHCATCHGVNGDGVLVSEKQGEKIALPALAGNRAVTLANTTNLVRIITRGGYAPSTQGNPRPYGMPPFVHVLTDREIAAVTTHIRQSFGNQASSVSDWEVHQARQGAGH